MTFLVNLLVGIAQFFTITFFLVGLFWVRCVRLQTSDKAAAAHKTPIIEKLLVDSVGRLAYNPFKFVFVGRLAPRLAACSELSRGASSTTSRSGGDGGHRNAQFVAPPVGSQAGRPTLVAAKDSILHRRDVKTLVAAHKNNMQANARDGKDAKGRKPGAKF